MELVALIFLTGWQQIPFLVLVVFMSVVYLFSLGSPAAARHVEGWYPWLWRIFWLLVAVEMVANILSVSAIVKATAEFYNLHLFYTAVLILGAILSNLSSWKPKTKSSSV